MKHFRAWYPLIILLLATLILFHELLVGRVLFWGVVSIQFYPWREAAFDQLRSGVIPFWNPLIGNGAPLLANLQTAVFYPPNWLYLFIPTHFANGLIAVLHVLWAGLGMWFYLSRLELDRLARGVGSISFALGGYLITRLGFLSITIAVPWLPWLFWAMDGLILEKKPHHWRYMGYFGLFTGLQLLAGHAQTSFYSLVFVGIYALWVWLKLKPLSQRLAFALIAVGLGVLLASIQLFPTAELLSASPRSTGADMQEAFELSFWPWRFITLFAPGFFGTPGAGNFRGASPYWEDALYLGLLPLLTAGVLLVRKRKPDVIASNHIVFFSIIVLPVTLLALGRYTPVFPWLFENIPTFDLFRGPTRWMLLTVFSICVLGAIGVHAWRMTKPAQQWAARLITIGLALLIAAGASHFVLAGSIDQTFIFAAARLGFVLVVTASLLMLLPYLERRMGNRLAWECLALSVLALDLVTAYWRANPTIEPSFFTAPVNLEGSIVEALQGGRTLYLPEDEATVKFEEIFLFGDSKAGDSEHWQGLRYSLVPNLGTVTGVPSANNDDPLTVGFHTDLVKEVDATASIEMIEQMNVYVLLAAVPRDDLALLGRAGLAYAYQIPDPWPRAAVADCTTPTADMVSCTRRTEADVRILLDTPNKVELEVNADESAWLVLTDTYYPGWHASVDGSLEDIQRANGAFRAVPVPQGQSFVEFNYRQKNFILSLTLSCASFLMLLALIIVPTRLGQKHD